ncbi:MAG: hypothetical protein ACLVLA_03490 [Acidaminococcus intestini]
MVRTYPLPTDGKERFDSGYMLYYSVSDPTIHNMLDLKAAVHDIFTDSLASFIISGNKMYRQADNKLLWHLPPKSKPSQGYTDLQLEPSVKRPDCCDGKDPGLCR